MKLSPALSNYFSIKGALLFSIIFLFVSSPNDLLNKVIKDDASYISHAFTLGLDGDLNYANEPVDPQYAKLVSPPHPIGSGLLAAPFVAIFSVIDRIIGHPVIVNHNNYIGSLSIFGFVLAVNIMFFLGIFFYIKSLKLLNLLKSELWMIVLFIFSSTIPYFILNRYFFSHGFEFFAVSIYFWCVIKIYNKIRAGESIKLYLYLYSILFSLNLFVRYSNLNLFLLTPITFLMINLFIDNGNDSKANKRIFNHLYLLLFISLISIIPNLFLFYYTYGDFIPKPSFMYDKPLWLESYSLIQIISILITRIPYIFNIIFGSELGLLYTNPVIPIGFVSIIMLVIVKMKTNTNKINNESLLIGLIVLFFGFGISFHLWWQGMASSYGYRYLLQTFPVALFGVLITYNYLRDNQKQYFRYYKRLLLIFSTISIFAMVFFSSTEKLSLTTKVNTFNIQKAYSGKGYMFDLPGEIIKPYTWLRIVGKSTFGYIISSVIVDSNLNIKSIVKKIFPNDNYERRDIDFRKYIERSKSLDKNIIYQLLILLFVWFIFGSWLGTYSKGILRV